MEQVIFSFTCSILEILFICGILILLEKSYGRLWKVVLLSAALAAVTTFADWAGLDMNTGLNVICLALLLSALYPVKIVDAFFDAVTGMMLCQIIQLILIFFIGNAAPELIREKSVIYILLFLLNAGIYCVSYFVDTTALQAGYARYKRAVWMVFVNFYFIQIVYMCNWNETETVGVSMFILVGLIFATNVLLVKKIVLAKKQEELIRYHRELADMKETYIRELAEKSHEFARHMQLIHQLSLHKDPGEALSQIRTYTEEWIKERNHKSSAFFYAGNSILSALLTQKKKEADEKKIHLSMLIKEPLPSMPCSSREMVEIAGNLIDNAVEAAELLEEEQRKVFFEIGKDKTGTFFMTINYRGEEASLEKEDMLSKGFSTKKGELRGYGLPNIKSIAEQYQGKITIQMNDEVVIIKVLF